MANLRDETARDRGQIILVTGFALAVAFVSLALVMNSVIYTENLATRSEASKASDAVTVKQDVTSGAEAIFDYVNANNDSSYVTLRANLTAGVGAMSDAIVSQQVATGNGATVSLVDQHNGTRVGQTDGTRGFTAANGTGNWTVVQSVDDVETARFQVDSMGTPEATFDLIAESAAGDTWTMTLVNTSGTGDDRFELYVTEEGAAAVDCGGVNSGDWLNLTASGLDCGGTTYELGSGMGAVDRLAFEGGQNVTEGRYAVFVGNASASIADDAYVDSAGGSPYVEPQVYNVTLHYEYEEQRLAYATDITVGPGERDD